MEDNERAVFRVQSSERALDEVAVREMAGVVRGDGRLVERADLDLDRAAPLPAGFVEAAVDKQAVQPGVELVGITKPREVAPGTHEGVLDGIPRELAVSQDEARGRVQAGRRRRRKHGKGVVIASRCPLDELPPVHGPWSLTLGPAHDVPGSKGMALAQGDSLRIPASAGRGQAGGGGRRACWCWLATDLWDPALGTEDWREVLIAPLRPPAAPVSPAFGDEAGADGGNGVELAA